VICPTPVSRDAQAIGRKSGLALSPTVRVCSVRVNPAAGGPTAQSATGSVYCPADPQGLSRSHASSTAIAPFGAPGEFRTGVRITPESRPPLQDRLGGTSAGSRSRTGAKARRSRSNCRRIASPASGPRSAQRGRADRGKWSSTRAMLRKRCARRRLWATIGCQMSSASVCRILFTHGVRRFGRSARCFLRGMEARPTRDHRVVHASADN